jgi:hypothetical protein
MSISGAFESLGGAIGDLAKKHPTWQGLTWLEDKLSPDASKYDLPGQQERQQRLLGLAGRLGSYETPTMDQGTMDFWRRKMMGEDSLAEKQLEKAAGQSRRFALSQAASGRGNPAMAARLASQRLGQTEADLASQSAEAGIKERAAAGQLMSQMGGQNLAAALQAQALRQKGLMGMSELELRQAIAQMGGQMALAQQPEGWEKMLAGGGDLAKYLGIGA